MIGPMVVQATEADVQQKVIDNLVPATQIVLKMEEADLAKTSFGMGRNQFVRVDADFSKPDRNRGMQQRGNRAGTESPRRKSEMEKQPGKDEAVRPEARPETRQERGPRAERSQEHSQDTTHQPQQRRKNIRKRSEHERGKAPLVKNLKARSGKRTQEAMENGRSAELKRNHSGLKARKVNLQKQEGRSEKLADRRRESLQKQDKKRGRPALKRENPQRHEGRPEKVASVSRKKLQKNEGKRGRPALRRENPQKREGRPERVASVSRKKLQKHEGKRGRPALRRENPQTREGRPERVTSMRREASQRHEGKREKVSAQRKEDNFEGRKKRHNARRSFHRKFRAMKSGRLNRG